MNCKMLSGNLQKLGLYLFFYTLDPKAPIHNSEHVFTLSIRNTIKQSKQIQL